MPSSSEVLANGIATIDFTASVSRCRPPVQIAFSTSNGHFRRSGQATEQVQTDATCHARTALVSSTDVGIVVVEASTGSLPAERDSVRFVRAFADSVTVAASSRTVKPDSTFGGQIQITAVLWNQGLGHASSNSLVQFSFQGRGGDPDGLLAQTSVRTDAQGSARTGFALGDAGGATHIVLMARVDTPNGSLVALDSLRVLK